MKTAESEITINPDPQILHVLTYLEMRPIDSLCELIDNAIDAFPSTTYESGALIMVDIPSRKEVEEGFGKVRVRDNGPGMTLEQVENSLKAGYSSKSRHGTLGLFGVGFNIATGKLGRLTRLVTTRLEDDYAIETQLDLVTLRKSGNFKVKANKIRKPEGLQHGTIVEVSLPWHESSQNYGYMMKLVSIGRPKALFQLGRIYATILRDKKVRIMLGDDTVEPYHHCAWGCSRFVEHQKHGKIPAVFRFKDKVIHTYVKCADCGATIPEGFDKCVDVTCKSASTITQEERISGWVGIQRYLDSSHFGIDLIRNGRAIRVLEKQAFFEFQDPETGDPIVDYPIDDRQGRIIGEVHIDHVPVDPAKQNFERSSPEWRRAIEFLRGKSSLQPSQPGAETNVSPIFKLYQGYRKVRGPGRRSMTMGKWLPGSSEPAPLSKSEIDKMKEAFTKREPGYFDDIEWWKLVEQAEQKPVAGLRKCPSCHLEAQDGVEECPSCGHIFEGKNCIVATCGALISRSAVNCQYCGANQIPKIKEPWACSVCSCANSSDVTSCVVCSYARGTPSPVGKEGLGGVSHKDENLSINGLAIGLANGALSSPVDVVAYLTDKPIFAIRSDGSQNPLPSVRFIGEEIEIYIDPQHSLYQQAGITFEHQIAIETALYIYDYYKSLAAKNPAEHSITKITHDILKKYWPDKYSAFQVDSELNALFGEIRQKLADAIVAESVDIYNNLPKDEKNALATELVRHGRDIAELSQLKESGQFLFYLRPKGLLDIFRLDPKLFFDGKVWNVTYSAILSTHPDAGVTLQNHIKTQYGCLLEIAAFYAEKGASEIREAEIARAACKLLSAKLTN